MLMGLSRGISKGDIFVLGWRFSSRFHGNFNVPLGALVMKISLSRSFTAASLVFALVLLCSQQLLAETLKSKLEVLLQDHRRIVASEYNVSSREKALSSVKALRFPSLSATSSLGREHQVNPGANNTSLTPRDLNLTVTQLITDFGALKSNIEQIRTSKTQSQEGLRSTRMGVLLEAISAHIGLYTAQILVRYSEDSVFNIRRQTELESARVSKGSGFSTDVLQAKAQLAGAEARLLQTMNNLYRARNRYVAVFGTLPEKESKMEQVLVPVAALPESLVEALATARSENPQLRSQQLNIDIARQSISSARATGFFPTLNLVVDHKMKRSVASVDDFERESIIKLELVYNFNLGGSTIHNYRSQKDLHTSSLNQYHDALNLVNEQVKNAWYQYDTARRNAVTLENQANIAGEFARLAVEERQLGRRSLLEVLAAETARINAVSDAIASLADVRLSAFGLLSAIGTLSLDVIE